MEGEDERREGKPQPQALVGAVAARRIGLIKTVPDTGHLFWPHAEAIVPDGQTVRGTLVFQGQRDGGAGEFQGVVEQVPQGALEQDGIAPDRRRSGRYPRGQ